MLLSSHNTSCSEFPQVLTRLLAVQHAPASRHNQQPEAYPLSREANKGINPLAGAGQLASTGSGREGFILGRQTAEGVKS